MTIKDAARYPLILPPQHLTTWRVVDYVFQKYHLNYRVALEAGGWEVIKRYVELGLGISIVTSICLTGKEELAAIPFHRYFPKRTYGIVQHKGKLLAPPAARFVELIKARAKPERRRRRWTARGFDRGLIGPRAARLPRGDTRWNRERTG